MDTEEDNHKIHKSKLNPVFVIASEKERVYVQCFLNKYNIQQEHCQVTPVDSGLSYEVMFDYEEKRYILEFKIRTFESDHFDSGIIEQVKWDRLLQTSERLNAIPVYVMCYTDEIMRLWSLKSVIQPVWEPMWLPKDGPNKKDYEWKDAGYLPNSSAMRRRLNQEPY